jgi:hypothetical protein
LIQFDEINRGEREEKEGRVGLADEKSGGK